MAVIVAEKELPKDISYGQAVEAAYSHDMAECASRVQRGLPVLIECEKELAPFIYANLRDRFKAINYKSRYLDGRLTPEEAAAAGPAAMGGLLSVMLNQLRDEVRGAVERKVIFLPHLDLLTTSQGGLTTEAREAIPLLYENPEVLWIGFKDPSFPLPKVIENLFPHKISLIGLNRSRLPRLITQKEARKFSKDFNPWALYKYVSGLNAIRLRKLLSTLEGMDYPDSPKHVIRQLRQATLCGSLEIPEIDLDRDLGGYAKVKKRLKTEVLEVLSRKETLADEEDIKRLEELIPKGMIFWGPPGTGKTLFAKAIATALGAAITIVSGPELKSKWVGESEENLRQIFRRARQSAPAIIVFDELDSFATARGTYTGSGVEHSMVNQLLTEMDGFHKEEMVFVIGTTNFAESLDPALLRPGRFEFHLHIPYPEADDRREIYRIYDKKMNLKTDDAAIESVVKKTGEYVPGTHTPYSGDHINALCRAIARFRFRENRLDEPTQVADIDRAVTEWLELPDLTKSEEFVVATHEVGHAVVSLFCKHSSQIDRISIKGDIAGALGFVRYQEKTHKYVVTRGQLLDDLCILMGGREAEQLFLEDLSIGSSGDLRRATEIARALVEEFGMGGENVGVRRFLSDHRGGGSERISELSEAQRAAIDREVGRLLTDACQRASSILKENRSLAETLRDMLLKEKVIEAKTIGDMFKNYQPQADPEATTQISAAPAIVPEAETKVEAETEIKAETETPVPATPAKKSSAKSSKS